LVAITRLTATRLIYVSDAHRAMLPIADDLATVIHNALDPAFLAARVGADSREQPFDVVMLSYNRAYKGVPEFIALAGRLSARQDIHFHLVLSDGADGLAAAPRLANLTIHPPSDHPETFYRRAGVVLNLSRPDLCVETFGLTLLEAMAFGVPVIAPPVGGPAELIQDGCEGYLIDSRDGRALAEAVERLADDDATYHSMSLAARARAEQFDAPRFRAALSDVIDAAKATREHLGKALS
jgi:glycosyltransferase involved in cell wall biosynthesis